MKSRGGGFWVSVTVFGVISLSSLAWWMIWSASAERRLDAKLAELEREGFPVDMSALAPAPVPDDENGALRFERAFAMLPDGDIDEALALIEQGAACERFRYSIDYAQGRGAALPHVSKFLDVVRLLAARAEQSASIGAADEAARSLEMVLGLAHSLKDEPLMISQMVRCAALGIAVDTFDAVRRQVELPAPMLRRALARLDPTAVAEGIRQAYRGELALGAAFVAEVREQETLSGSNAIDILVARPLVQNDLIALLDFLARMARAGDLPYGRARLELAAVEHEMGSQSRWLHPLTADQIYAAASLHESLSRQQERVAIARENVRSELERFAAAPSPAELLASTR